MDATVGGLPRRKPMTMPDCGAHPRGQHDDNQHGSERGSADAVAAESILAGMDDMMVSDRARTDPIPTFAQDRPIAATRAMAA